MKITKTRSSMVLPIIGRWHFTISMKPDLNRYSGNTFQLGVFKINNLPPEGEMITKKNYSGFWFRWEVDLFNFGFSYNLPKFFTPPQETQ